MNPLLPEDHNRQLDRISNRLANYVKTQMDKHWLDWPTIRELAVRYRIKQNTVIDIVESHENLDLIVGMKTYNGYGEFENKGDYRVEWYD